jgi:hypothetical protein
LNKRKVHLTSEEGCVLASALMEKPTLEDAPTPDMNDLARQLQERFMKAHEGALRTLRENGEEITRQHLRSTIDRAISDAQIIPAILHVLRERLLEVVHANMKPLAEAMADKVMGDPELGDQLHTAFEAMKTSYINEALGEEP